MAVRAGGDSAGASDEVSDRARVSSGSPFEDVIGFSRAVKVGDTVSVSGTAPIGPDGNTVGIGDPAAQTRQCIEIIQSALIDLGADLRHVVRTRIYLTRIEDWEEAGRAHGEFFSEIKPASTMVQVAGLINTEWLVEIEADAVIGGTESV